MTIKIGDRLPEAELLRIGESGPEKVALSELTGDRKVVIFGVPGAYTPTCSGSHVPSFVDSMAGLADKGIEEVICISVNDPFVMRAWGEATGATGSGINMLADAAGEFTREAGFDFSLADAGFFGRSARYSMYAENGVVRALNIEDSPGACGITRGERLLDMI